MSDALQQLLEGPPLESEAFPENSRYHGVRIRYKSEDGEQIPYLSRRFLPAPGSFVVTHEHTVTAQERLDQIAASELGDPELSWRIADANNAMRPADLTESIGTRLRIPLPEGVPGGSNE